MTSSLSHRQRLAAIAAGSAGNLIEWFDFYVYAFTALYFAASFFPEVDRTTQLLSVAGVYAVGFLIRPVGGSAPGLRRCCWLRGCSRDSRPAGSSARRRRTSAKWRRMLIADSMRRSST